MKKQTAIAALCVLLLLALCACGRTQTDTAAAEEEPLPDLTADTEARTMGEALNATYASDTLFSINALLDSSFHPYNVTSSWNRMVDMLIYEPLIFIDENFDPQPNLITAWSTEDGLTWSFSLDTSRAFHSGGHVTSYDASYSIRMIMAVDCRYTDRFENVRDIATPDEATMTVTLSAVDYNFYKLLNVPCIESGTYSESVPPGTGPYKLSESGDMLLLDSSHPDAEDYPLLRIYLTQYDSADELLQAFEDSSVDLVENDPSSMSNLGYSKTNIICYVDTSNMHYLGYNMNSFVFSQRAYRVLFDAAVDRSEIVSGSLSGAGVAASLPIHPNCSLYPEETAKNLYSTESWFQQALADTGMTDLDGDGKLDILSGVSMTGESIDFIVCSESSTKVAAARWITDRLQNAGVPVSLRELSYDSFVEALENGDYDVYYGEVKLRPDWDCSELFTAGSDLNFSGTQDASMLNFYSQLRTTPEEGQPALLESMAEYMAVQVPFTVICFEKTEVLYHRGVLSGLNPTQDNYFNDMSAWTVNLTVGSGDE